MEKIMFITGLVLLSVSALFSLYKHFQMLQQNSYFPSRYFKWVKGEKSGVLMLSFVYLAVFALSAFKDLRVITAVLSAVLLAVSAVRAFKIHKKSIKPLVFTKRVIRLYVAAAVVPLLLSVLTALFYEDTASLGAFYCLSAFFICFSPVLCITAWIITKPLEALFNRYYINDAKRILKESPSLTVIGITGSYGKTTTKFILNRILSEKFNTVCTPASFNTPLGVVRTVREKIKPETNIFICEMGAKNIGDIKEICDIVNPSYGIITSVGAQHLETFKTVDNVFKTKFELCDHTEKTNGKCFALLDSAGIKERATLKPFCTYIGNSTEYYADSIVSSSAGTSFVLHLKGEEIPVYTKLLGSHAVSDILCAASLAFALGVSADDIKVAVSSLKPTEHRLELKSFINGSLVIDDAYNSNPEGCIEALRVLGSFEGFRKTVITPGLVELGEKEEEYNYNLGLACSQNADDIIFVGANRSKPMKDAVDTTDFDSSRVHIVSSFKEGLEIYKTYAQSNCVLLIENDLPDNYLN